MQQFEVTLKNEKSKFYKLIALLLVALNIVTFISIFISGVHLYEAATALLVSGLYVIYLFYLSGKNNRVFFIDRVTFFILAGGWVALQNYLPALACIVLGILYHLSLQNLQFRFNNDFVTKMNFPQKEYPWDAFTNVMLRGNILTVDFRNNKLIQLEIEGDIDETGFNEFTRQHLFKEPVP